MWWSRRAALRGALLGAMSALAGCGLRPMYLPAGGESPVPEFALVRVAAIPTRTGQLLRNALLDLLTPAGEPAKPRYLLRVDVDTRSIPLAIQSDASVTRYNLHLDVDVRLLDADTGESLYRDKILSVGSYNAVRSDFATLIAEKDTERRTAVVAGEEIAALLAVYFARRSPADD